MGMTRTSELFEKLSKSNNLVTVTLCEEVQTLYLSILKGHIGAGEILPYIQEHKILDRAPERYRADFAELLDLITMLGAAQ